MPWTNQTGGQENGPNDGSKPAGEANPGGSQVKGPWGQPTKPAKRPPQDEPSGLRPPDFETLLSKWWEELRRHVPPGALGRNGLSAMAALAVGLWLVSGVYTVNPQEQGVVLRFGAFIKHTGPGTHYHLPWPIETAYTPNVKKINQVDVGFKQISDKQSEDITDESYMLTGDENIVDMQFTVNWRIKDANAWLFNVDLGAKNGDTVKAVAESAMREAVGQDRIDLIMTSHREEIQLRVQRLMQQMLDSYNAGVEIVGVKMQKAETPTQVRAAYLDVQKALADQDRKRSEAEAYRNSVIPEAKGAAAHIIQEAEGYKAQVVALATGEAQRFNAVYQEYKKAPEVTRRRIYIETMSQVMGSMNKVIVDDAAKGVMPYLQLPPMPSKMAPKQDEAPKAAEKADIQ
ncbi:membrane protease subunit HflK [Rhizomicrobium palustre]|uniref:Protein HflK n=1 Tax=Rhizomicrobium palustre TaxID=189966 RepID=A0A846MWC4_9PROT|nr:membrane protease subunit HflK [Rhizomicrobium palustre]